MVREGRVFISALGTGKPAFGSNYYVQALEVGAQVTVGSSGTTVTVAAGHGFAAGDKYMKSLDAATYSGVSTVASVTATTLTLDSALSVSEGDILINLGADTGSSTPNYDGNGVTIYSDMDYSTSVTNATVTADSNGRYVYYHRGIERWELVRTGSTLTALYKDTGSTEASSEFRVDYDADGFYELRSNISGESYGFFGPTTKAGFAHQDTIDETSLGSIDSYNGLTHYSLFTGNASASFTRNGIFSVMRYGASNSGGGTGGSVGGTADIAAGIYGEYRGNGTVTNVAFGTESYVSIYNSQTLSSYVYGVYGAVSIVNSGGQSATISGDSVGVYGITKSSSGSAHTFSQKAIGVQGTVSIAGTGTIVDAMSLYATSGKTGATTITSSYGLKVDSIATGNTNNYGVWIYGASGGSGNNYSLYVVNGTTYLGETASNALYIRTSQIQMGAGTDTNQAFVFNPATSGDISPQIVFKGADGSNASFEFTRAIRNVSPQGALWIRGRNEELITLSTSGTTTDSSANLLPANSIIEAVTARITTTITTATDWKLGDATQAARFAAANSTLTSGTTSVGLAHADPTVASSNLGPVQTAAAKLRITTTGTPGAGAIRVTVFYRQFQAATA